MGLFDSIFARGEQARSDELDARRKVLEQRRADMGLITQAQADANQNAIDAQRLDVNAEIEDAAAQGLKEGYDNTTGAIKSTLAAPFKFTWAIIPWQLLVFGGLALFFYLGGWAWLKPLLKKR